MEYLKQTYNREGWRILRISRIQPRLFFHARSTSQAKQTKPTYRRLPPLLEPDFLRGANVEAGVVGAKDIWARKVKIVSTKYEEVEMVSRASDPIAY